MMDKDSVKQLDAILRPQSVAVIGASTSPDKMGHEILKNIIDSGFKGSVHPINPKADVILDLPCHKSVKDIEGPVDLAVIIIPARFVPQAVQECGEKGVKGAIIITGGFAEAGEEGEELQQQVIAAAQKFDVRLIGPNCQGVNNPHHPLCASWPLLTYAGKVALISQSGTVGAAMMDWFSEEKLGTSSFVSMGNRADVDEADLIAYFNQDPNTEVIAAYIEGIKRPEQFIQAVEQLQKPLVILKSGRTPKGKVAAESHTKALAGADAIYEALFAKYDICRAYTAEEFYDYAKALAYLKPPQGNRILFITTSGGAAILATDQAEQEGLDVSPLPQEAVEAITPLIPAHAIKANPVDLTGDATARMFGDVMEVTRKYYDTLGVIFGDPVEDASKVVTADANELIIFYGGADVERHESELMHLKGIPVFPTPERGIKALARVLERKTLDAPQRPTLTVPAAGRQLPLHQAFARIAEQGLPCTDFALADSQSSAVQIAKEQGFPVALKISSPDILHKSDVGGVKLNLGSAEALEKAFDELLSAVKSSNPQARIDGVLVSKMASPGLEVIAGMNRDPQFGPVILFGLGGIMVEIFQDVSLRLLPLTREDALAMIREIKGYGLISGYRGRPAVDEEALADCLTAVARIAESDPEINEIDLNPLFAYPDGILVADARIIVRD
ncbi:MAG: acetate--CoA ligase family protein [Candidatus Desulfatibia sp.]|uniref:acetate--CoA ligase family protein n=1 Tax=Candidatus Desulfatibia sp. TaxID=3101189 RepID=UPI002F3304B8